MFKADDPDVVRAEIRKRLKDSETRRVILTAMELGAKVRLTASGVVLAGPSGTSNTHWTTSDWRAVKNLEAELRRIGIPMPRTGTKAGTRSYRSLKPDTRPNLIPANYEAPRQRTTTYTHVIEIEPEPEVLEDRPMRREPGTKARALSTRQVPARFAKAYARLSEALRNANPDLVIAALAAADDDPRRVTVQEDGSLMVWNHRAW